MEDSFLSWFSTGSSKKLKIFMVVTLGPSGIITILKGISPIIKLFYDKDKVPNDENLNAFLLNANFVFHLVFLFVVLLNSPVVPNINLKHVKRSLEPIKKNLDFDMQEDLNDPIEIAYNAEKEFLKYWRYFWVALFLLYVFWTIIQLANNQIHQSDVLSLVDTFFNNLAASFLFLCYFSLTKITIKLDDSNIDENEHVVDYSMKIYLLLATLTIIHLVCYLLSFQGYLLYNVKTINIFFKGISGLLFSLSIATLIGRLDSKFLNSPSSVIFILYSYAAIQPLFVFFDAPIFSNKMIFTLYLGLTLKIFFYLFVRWIYQTKRLFFYFLRARKLHFNINTNWNNIKNHLVNTSTNLDDEH